jgi:hypothetical protein
MKGRFAQALREAEALKALAERDLHERQRETRYHDSRVKEMQKELNSLRSSKGGAIWLILNPEDLTSSPEP